MISETFCDGFQGFYSILIESSAPGAPDFPVAWNLVSQRGGWRESDGADGQGHPAAAWGARSARKPLRRLLWHDVVA